MGQIEGHHVQAPSRPNLFAKEAKSLRGLTGDPRPERELFRRSTPSAPRLHESRSSARFYPIPISRRTARASRGGGTEEGVSPRPESFPTPWGLRCPSSVTQGSSCAGREPARSRGNLPFWSLGEQVCASLTVGIPVASATVMTHLSDPRFHRFFALGIVTFGLLSALSVACGWTSDDYNSADSDLGARYYGHP